MIDKYYAPTKSTVELLDKELQSLQIQIKPEKQKVIHIRKKEIRSLAKKKFDFIERIFQSMADVVYFLEFTEDHPELRDIYEKDLKELFGFTIDSDINQSSPQNRGPFERLIKASLLLNFDPDILKEDSDIPKKLDFRTHLAGILIRCSIRALLSSINDDRERSIISSDADRIWLWSELLQDRINDRKTPVRRSLYIYSHQQKKT